MITNIPIIATLISFFGFIIAAYKIIDEQKKHYKFKICQDKRLEYKLRIYEILISDVLTIDRIVSKFQDHSPFSQIDSIEIRKCIYEMLIEKNLITFDDGSYTVDTVSINEEDYIDKDIDHLR